MESRSPTRVEDALSRHLAPFAAIGETPCWTVKVSPLGGLGLFARRDVRRGELIAVDAPLLLGPRAQSKYLPLCVSCYKRECPLFPCERGCGLPICSDRCENDPTHAERECAYMRARRPTCGAGWSTDLLRLVLPVRALFLDEEQRELLDLLECHRGPRFTNSAQVGLLTTELSVPPTTAELELMAKVCDVMNTTSFESAVVVGERNGPSATNASSVRALYPLGALQNHSCRPNTRFHIDERQRCHVIASLPIVAGEELTMTYTDLLWDSTLRRKWLHSTKHFHCNCPRCADPSEFGTNLGALYCAADGCEGYLLPRSPLDPETNWICGQCGLILNYKQILSIRLNLTRIKEEVLYKSPRQILKFIKRDLPILVPSSSYITMDMKFRVVSYFGRTDDLSFSDMTEDELEIKSRYCQDLLAVLDSLGCGDCKRKGLILYELYCTNVEKYRRLRGRDSANSEGHLSWLPEVSLTEFSYDKHPTITDEKKIQGLLKQATDILQDDVLAMDDLKNCPLI